LFLLYTIMLFIKCKGVKMLNEDQAMRRAEKDAAVKAVAATLIRIEEEGRQSDRWERLYLV
jgi:hypothetical protein